MRYLWHIWLLLFPLGLWAQDVQIDLELYCTPEAVYVSQRYELPEGKEIPPDSLNLMPMVRDSLQPRPGGGTLAWKQKGETKKREMPFVGKSGKGYELPEVLRKKGLEEFTLLYEIRPTYRYRRGENGFLSTLWIDPAPAIKLSRIGATLNLSIDLIPLNTAGGSARIANMELSLRKGTGKQSFIISENGMQRFRLYLERTAWQLDHHDGTVRVASTIEMPLAPKALEDLQDQNMETAAYLPAVANQDTFRVKATQPGAEAIAIGNGLMLSEEVFNSFARIARVQLEVRLVDIKGNQTTVSRSLPLDDPRPPSIDRPVMNSLPLQLLYVAPPNQYIVSAAFVVTDFHERSAHPGEPRFTISELFLVRGLESR